MKFGIVPKLTVVFVAFAAALLAAVGWLTYSRGLVTVQQEVTTELVAVAGEKEAALNSWADDRQGEIATLAASPNVMADLAALVTAAPQSNGARSAHDQLVAVLKPRVDVRHEYASLLVMDAITGQVLAATEPTDEGTFKQDRLFFINGKSGPYTENAYYSASRQGPDITTAAPVRSADGKLLGVLAAQLNLSELNAIISRRTSPAALPTASGQAPRQTDDAYLVNNQSLVVIQPRLISDPAALQSGIHTQAVQNCLTHQSGAVLAQDYRDVRVIAAYRWLPARELCLVVKLDQAEAFAPAQALGQEILVIAVLALAAASILAAALARTITRPILALQAGAARFGAGELGVRFPESGSDELGRLAGEFNRMAAAVADKETKLREHANQLTQANKELEAFSYSVSHDLRAPLRAIDGFSRILMEDYADSLDSEAKRYLKIVRDNAQQMGHLIDDLLEFSRLSRHSLTLKLVAPADIVRQALATLATEQDGRRVDIMVGDLPACHGDARLLTQVFVNLLGNALKYTRRREIARIEVGCQAAEGENIYFVKDNGAGFDMQYAQKLFGVFQRLHRAEEFEGTGVGLAIVQRIIIRHGGRIWAEAAIDQGAAFYFTLPAIEQAEPAPSLAKPDAIAERIGELV